MNKPQKHLRPPRIAASPATRALPPLARGGRGRFWIFDFGFSISNACPSARGVGRCSSCQSKIQNPKSKIRNAFTLIELLVVVTVIAILLTFTIKVMGALLTSAKENATQVTIRKVQRLLADRAEALDRLTRRTGYLQTTPEFTQASNYCNGDPNLQKIIARKLIYRKYFPQRFDEVYAALQPKVAAAGAGASNIEIVYDFLTQSNVLGNLSDGVDSFSTSEVRDTDNDGLPEIVDAWGHPLRFYRWPTRLFRTSVPNTAPSAYWTGPTGINVIDTTNAKALIDALPSFSGNPQTDLSRDPDDPLKKCTVFNPYITPSGPLSVDFENRIPGVRLHTPATYHILLVVSAGPDGALGLYEPEDLTNKGHLAAVKPNPASALLPPDELLDDMTHLNVRGK